MEAEDKAEQPKTIQAKMAIVTDHRVRDLLSRRNRLLIEHSELECEHKVVTARRKHVNNQLEFINKELELLGQGQLTMDLYGGEGKTQAG